MLTGAATMENSMEVPQKVKNRNTLWSSNFTTGYLSKEYKNTNLEEYMHLYVCSSIICNSQVMEAAQVCINRWMDKEDVIYTQTFSHKKEWNLAIFNDMDEVGNIMLRI